MVIGGGDTGSDCIGTAIRQGAASVTQLEILPKPPERENKALIWPDWPLKLRSSHAHEEGAARDWAVPTKGAVGSNGDVEALDCVRVEWVKGDDGRMQMREVPGSDFSLKADLVLLAMGFLGPRRPGMLEQAGLALDARGNVRRTPWITAPRWTRCSPPATCGAASRWWSGRSARAGNAPARWMRS